MSTGGSSTGAGTGSGAQTRKLSDATQQAIDDAEEARDAAAAADLAHQQAVDTLTISQKGEADTAAAALEAHKRSSDLGHNALVKLAAELGVSLN